ncbi:MAG TPA: translation initiation factor IF-2 associated domain-containing protein, partial [Sphingorhabdus lacus]|nr:translation initiation factor IF-2 associated domain-containing protein [Sphingorhabdus lacus]
MSDDTNNKPTLTRKPLTLSRSLESGEVKQTFSHGRTNKVVVEVKRKKLVGKPGYAPEPEVAAPAPPPPPPPPPPVAAAPAPRPAPNDMLSRQERQAKLLREAEEARLAMLEESRRREDEARARAAEEEKRRAEENRKAEEAPAAPTPEPVVEQEPEPAVSNDDGAAPAPRRFTPVESPKRPAAAPAPTEREREEAKKAPHRPTRDRTADRRQSGKLTVTRALDDDEGARARSLAALKRAREKEKRLHGGGNRQQQPKQSR